MSLFAKISQFSVFMRKAWALSLPYFKSDQKWKALGMLAAIVALNLASVYLAVLFNDWYKLFYDALQTKNEPVFWVQLGRFTYLAFAFIIIGVYQFYLTQLLELRWRAWMTDHYLGRWLANHAFYQLELARFTGDAGATPDNPDQRIQEDLNLFTGSTISLSMGLLNSVVTLASFIGILWNLSGGFAFSFHGTRYNIPGFMVWMALLYCAGGSILTHYIGRPQIRLNFLQQRYEADFRHHMVRVREYSESIALDKGEAVERAQLDGRFSSLLSNLLKLIKAQKNLVWFTSFFSQAAVVFPFIVAAPRYFSGAIQLGGLMQIATAFGQVQGSLSWFVGSYSSLAAWRATTDRLTSFEEHMVAQSQLQSELNDMNSVATDTLQTHDLTLALPTGAVLLSGVNLQARAGDSVLVKGPSGSGKSTLFRAFAGIWPFARGRVEQPADSMFIPQRPYFPNGRLRDALAYPLPPDGYSDEALRQALMDALLPQLADQLDTQDAWSQKLSGGEQQRLAVARVLLKKPKWIFADEITSALDESAEKHVYEKLLTQVQRAGGAMISIAHRPALSALHGKRWTLAPLPDGGPAHFQVEETVA